jgi:hypothetical protein
MKTASKKTTSTDELDFKDHHLVFSHIRHNVRRHFELNSMVYMVIDMVFNLSRNSLCTLSKDEMAFELGCDRATVFRALKIGREKGLVYTPKGKKGLKTTRLWDDEILNDDVGKLLLQQQKRGNESQNATQPSQNATSHRRKMRPNTERETYLHTGGEKAPQIVELNGEQKTQLEEIEDKYIFLTGRKIKHLSKEVIAYFIAFLDEFEYNGEEMDNALEKFCSDSWRQSTGNIGLKLLFKAENYIKFSRMTWKQLIADNDRYYQKTGVFPKVKHMKDYYKQFEVKEEEPEITEKAFEEPFEKEITLEKARNRAKGFLIMGTEKSFKMAQKLADEWGFELASIPDAWLNKYMPSNER